MKVNIKKVNENAIIPTQATQYSAGYDLYACLNDEKIDVAPGETVKIGTGIATEIPENYFGGIFARSGLATKKGLRPSNCTGVVDSDYRGEIIVAIHNDSGETQTIMDKERIGQLIIIPYLTVEFNEVTELNDTQRGEGGFGSTGTK